MIVNLVYDEFIDFLKDNGMNYDLQEGYYWLDRMIIRAFDKQGKEHKILRIYVDDDFNISFKDYKTRPFKMESWQETAIRHKDRILQLEQDSIAITKQLLNKYKITHLIFVIAEEKIVRFYAT